MSNLTHIAICAVLASALGACATVCPTAWETHAGVSHSVLFGPGYESSVGISGAIGKECREGK